MLPLHLLQDDAHRVGHELLHYLPQGFALLLEARRQLREQREVALLGVRGHRVQAAVHRAHEAIVRFADQAVEVGGRLRHPRSIERGLWAFNAFLLILLCAGVARADTDSLHLGGWIEGLAVGATGDGPRQQPAEIGDFHRETPLRDHLRTECEVRGRLGGPYEGGPGAGVQNFDDTFQNHSPYFEFPQAWVAWEGHSFDVRGGLQKLTWGKLDGGAPTDVVNPRDFHDPLVEEFEERKIGVPMLLGNYYLPDLPAAELSQLRVSLAWTPFAVPSRIPLLEERWFPITAIPPSQITVPKSVLAQCGPPGSPPPAADLHVPIATETANHAPPRGFTDGGIGVRLSGTWRDADWDLSHYTGPETGPDLQTVADVSAKNPLQPHAVARITQAHDFMHMTGADVALPLGGFTVRAEAAWFVGRPYLRQGRDLLASVLGPSETCSLLQQVASANGKPVRVPLADLFPSLDSVEWGIGADYLWHGWLPLLQLNRIEILGAAPRLLIHKPETRLLGSLRKRFLGDRLELEMRATYEVERGAWVVFPRFSYVVGEHIRLRLGYLALGGTRHSVFGQYGGNDEFVMQARYTF